jgi:hypothetical protein
MFIDSFMDDVEVSMNSMICYVPGCICCGSQNFWLGSLHDDYSVLAGATPQFYSVTPYGYDYRFVLIRLRGKRSLLYFEREAPCASFKLPSRKFHVFRSDAYSDTCTKNNYTEAPQITLHVWGIQSNQNRSIYVSRSVRKGTVHCVRPVLTAELWHVYNVSNITLLQEWKCPFSESRWYIVINLWTSDLNLERCIRYVSYLKGGIWPNIPGTDMRGAAVNNVSTQYVEHTQCVQSATNNRCSSM